MNLTIDLSQTGYTLIFKEYQETALKTLWKSKYPMSSREVWAIVKEVNPISRAAIINFLNDMVTEGILDYTTKTGKGGYHRLYVPLLSPMQLWNKVAQTVNKKLVDAASTII